MASYSEGSAAPEPHTRWGREKVRAALGLAVWEVELAAETGLLHRLADRRFDARTVEAALADPESFRATLAAEHRLNATDAARRLGISRERFTRVVADAGLEPVAEEQVHKYRTVLTVRYYRAADVDALQSYVGADIALREAVTAVGRSDAAKKAARTRAQNRQRAREARLELSASAPDRDARPVQVLRYAAGLAAGRPRPPSFLRRFTHDPEAARIAVLVAECRFRDSELADMLGEILERAQVAHSALAGPEEVRRRLGVDPQELTGRADTLEGCVERSALTAWEESPPQWLLAQRAALAAAEAEAAAYRARAREEERLLDAAERAARLTDEAVAEILGLPVDVVAELRPRKRSRWTWEYVSQLRSHPPAWLRSEAAAREEAARRAAHRASTEDRKAKKRRGWREAWAKQMGVPVERVPKRVGKPTPAAIRAAQANPPRWAKDE